PALAQALAEAEVNAPGVLRALRTCLARTVARHRFYANSFVADGDDTLDAYLRPLLTDPSSETRALFTSMLASSNPLLHKPFAYEKDLVRELGSPTASHVLDDIAGRDL